MSTPARHVLGVDLGGTTFKAAIVSADGAVTGFMTAPSAEAAGPRVWQSDAVELAGRVLTATDAVPVAIGVSVPGAVDRARARLVDLVDRLDAGDGIALADTFGSFGLPVAADNDARAALAAERRFGAARGSDNAVALTLGTGLGGAAVVNGVPAGGDPVLAGSQIGHFTVALDGPVCVCGNRGCAETFASAAGLMRMAAEAGLDASDPAAVFAHPDAPPIVERFADALVAVVVTAIHAYQPDLVVLGGGLMGAADCFMPRVTAEVERRAWTTADRAVRVVVSTLGDRIGVLGAAAVALNHLEEPS